MDRNYHENYELIKQIGAGSFGNVFRAKRRSDNTIVAFKITSKKKRTDKELISLRGECEVQKGLSHPNLVRMFDSFETNSEFIVVTEHVDKELYELLVKAGRLSEEQSQVIACDLVSALYYLHSKRIVHRDIKPQNVLLDSAGVAKLCDFGFARFMGPDTHVLSSVKGTPLYMAPELYDEKPVYDHNVDLWSLGCIVYELVVGKPVFMTSSMRNLQSMILQADIKWPEHVTEICCSFIKGLLQKCPSERLTWPELTDHPFVKGRILIINEDPVPRALTSPLSQSQAQAKQQQLYVSLASRLTYQSKNIVERQIKKIGKKLRRSGSHTTESESGASVDVLLNNLSVRASLRSDLVAADYAICKVDGPIVEEEAAAAAAGVAGIVIDVAKKECDNEDEDNVQDVIACSSPSSLKSTAAPSKNNSISKQLAKRRERLGDWSPKDNEQPIENEEWLEFLQKSMEEVMIGEVDSLLQESLFSVFVGPLKNPAANCQVIDFIACLLSLPYVVESVKSENLDSVQRVYLDTKVVPNLVYSVKLLIREDEGKWKTHSGLLADELQALERVMTILSRLVHVNDEFLEQFCGAVSVVPDGTFVFQYLFGLDKRKSKVVANFIAIINQILRSKSGFTDVTEDIVFKDKTENEMIKLFAGFMTHKQSIVRSRGCTLLLQLALNLRKRLQRVWGRTLRDLLEGLTGDADKSVHDAAIEAIKSLKKLPFYGLEHGAENDMKN